mgnify:CR=1 FL=1
MNLLYIQKPFLFLRNFKFKLSVGSGVLYQILRNEKNNFSTSMYWISGLPTR